MENPDLISRIIVSFSLVERVAVDFDGIFGADIYGYAPAAKLGFMMLLYVGMVLLGPLLIFRKEPGEAERFTVRRFGFFWFFLFYSCHIVVSAYLDLWLMLGQGGDVTGAILFLAKAALVVMLFLSLWQSRERAMDA